jgi:hypothetical protein
MSSMLRHRAKHSRASEWYFLGVAQGVDLWGVRGELGFLLSFQSSFRRDLIHLFQLDMTYKYNRLLPKDNRLLPKYNRLLPLKHH